jgi:hypothetical protein
MRSIRRASPILSYGVNSFFLLLLRAFAFITDQQCKETKCTTKILLLVVSVGQVCFSIEHVHVDAFSGFFCLFKASSSRSLLVSTCTHMLLTLENFSCKKTTVKSWNHQMCSSDFVNQWMYWDGTHFYMSYGLHTELLLNWSHSCLTLKPFYDKGIVLKMLTLHLNVLTGVNNAIL